jgi:SulP family sulfate permease
VIKIFLHIFQFQRRIIIIIMCVQVAAIEMDMGSALDTNAELITVGVSNFLSGILGGFTGSYIFSQTIFGFRTGFHFRSVAVVMIVLQVAVFLVTLDPLSYIPLFFFAATLIFIGIDLMLEWLLEVSHCGIV